MLSDELKFSLWNALMNESSRHTYLNKKEGLADGQMYIWTFEYLEVFKTKNEEVLIDILLSSCWAQKS